MNRKKTLHTLLRRAVRGTDRKGGERRGMDSDER